MDWLWGYWTIITKILIVISLPLLHKIKIFVIKILQNVKNLFSSIYHEIYSIIHSVSDHFNMPIFFSYLFLWLIKLMKHLWYCLNLSWWVQHQIQPGTSFLSFRFLSQFILCNCHNILPCFLFHSKFLMSYEVLLHLWNSMLLK